MNEKSKQAGNGPSRSFLYGSTYVGSITKIFGRLVSENCIDIFGVLSFDTLDFRIFVLNIFNFRSLSSFQDGPRPRIPTLDCTYTLCRISSISSLQKHKNKSHCDGRAFFLKTAD